MNIDERIKSFSGVGERLKQFVANSENALTESDFNDTCINAYGINNWFTRENIVCAVSAWADLLTLLNLNKWIEPYRGLLEKNAGQHSIGVINAGNIPFVGMHDFVSVLISGNNYLGKNSSDDIFLLPFIAKLLIEIEPGFQDKIVFQERLGGMDAVIATGSNNSSRYFEYYFGKYPHIIRKNRNAVAVLSGNESTEELKELGKDIFQYFGLGCRSVSKLYVPRGYDFKNFFEAIVGFSSLMNHNKYMNNFEYNNAVLLLKQIPFLQNGFLIVREEASIPSPISVLHYEFYDSLNEIKEKLNGEKEKIQCVVSNTLDGFALFGQSQSPRLWDYADGIDTIKFLSALD